MLLFLDSNNEVEDKYDVYEKGDPVKWTNELISIWLLLALEAAMDDGVAVDDLDGLAVRHLDGTVDDTPVGANDGASVGADDGTSDGILCGHWTWLCAGTVLDATENAARLLQLSGFISD